MDEEATLVAEFLRRCVFSPDFERDRGLQINNIPLQGRTEEELAQEMTAALEAEFEGKPVHCSNISVEAALDGSADHRDLLVEFHVDREDEYRNSLVEFSVESDGESESGDSDSDA